MLFFNGVNMLEIIIVLMLMGVSVFFGAFVTFLGNTAMCRKYSKEVCVKMLLILYSMDETIKQIDSEKYTKMQETGFSNSDIRGQRNVDSYDVQRWRNNVITEIVTRYPFPQDFHDF